MEHATAAEGGGWARARRAGRRRRVSGASVAIVAVVLAAGASSATAARGAAVPGTVAHGAPGAAPVAAAAHTSIFPPGERLAKSLSGPDAQAEAIRFGQAAAARTAVLLGLGQHNGLRVRTARVLDEGGRRTDATVTVKYDRTYAGLDVVGGMIGVSATRSGEIRDVHVDEPTQVTLPTTVPAITAGRAAATARAAVAGTAAHGAAPGRQPRLVVFGLRGTPTLAWHTVVADDRGSQEVYTDARDNRVLYRQDSAAGVAGVGRTQYSGTVGVEATQVVVGTGAIRYELMDGVRRDHSVLNWRTREVYVSPTNEWGNGEAGNSLTVAAEVQYGAAETWDYFVSTYGADVMRSGSLSPYSAIHATLQRSDWGAEWDPGCNCVEYSDADAVNGPPTSVDIVAHEWTHALTHAETGLPRNGEQGALDEATSDIFGTMVEFFANNPRNPGNYLIGEQPAARRPLGAVRRMDDPARGGAADCWTSTIAALPSDRASGVANHFFYLLAEGTGTAVINGREHRSAACNGATFEGIGRAAAARIWYEALTGEHFTRLTDYHGAREATVDAAREFYGVGSAECRAVERAWLAVHVSAGAQTCGSAAPPSGGVTRNAYLNALFNDYGNNAGCAEWSGADGTQSIVLPSGRRAWFFSDTYLGAVRQRPGFYRSFLNNSIVVQSGSNLRTITGGNTCQERNMSLSFWDRYAKTPVGDLPIYGNGWMWSGDGKVLGDQVVKFYYRNYRSGAWWSTTHTAIATIPVASLETGAVVQETPTLMPAVESYPNHPIIWGTALTDNGGFTYIYGWGTVDAANNKRLFLARVETANLADFTRWQFNTGSGDAWSARGNQAAARPLSGSPFIEAGFSVAQLNGAYWLIQHEPDLNGGDIVAHPATTPWGFTNRRVDLYTPPEGPRDAAHKHQYTYEARLHPGLGGTANVVVSYNVNTSAVSVGCKSRNDHDGGIYRPRFLNVPRTMFSMAAAASSPTPSVRMRQPAPAPAPDGRGVRASLPRPPAGATVPEVPAPAAGLAADLGWYDQWSASVQANGGCPALTQTTSLNVSSRTDGTAQLTWTDYGRDVWYWVYERDVTAADAFRRYELWSVAPQSRLQAVFEPERNGHEFAWYVVPWALGGSAADGNGDGRPDNEAARSNTASVAVRVYAPSAPATATWYPASPDRALVSWSRVTYPSDKVYYYVFSCQTIIRDLLGQWQLVCERTGPLAHTTLSAEVPRSGFHYYYVVAENIGGTSELRSATYEPPET
jgi:Zn-dependent metalloprotease